MDSTFLPLIFRMRHIVRWGLMYNTQQEDLMQHTAECAFITHYLAVLGNRSFNKNYDVNKLVVHALFHDVTEVLTGDLPTPVKYFNDDIRDIYKQIEKIAGDKLINHLPAELRNDYAPFLSGNELTAEEHKLLKIADKLCAYIKCARELAAGNNEFLPPLTVTREALDSIESEELAYFIAHDLAAFSLSLDELKGTL